MEQVNSIQEIIDSPDSKIVFEVTLKAVFAISKDHEYAKKDYKLIANEWFANKHFPLEIENTLDIRDDWKVKNSEVITNVSVLKKPRQKPYKLLQKFCDVIQADVEYAFTIGQTVFNILYTVDNESNEKLFILKHLQVEIAFLTRDELELFFECFDEEDYYTYPIDFPKSMHDVLVANCNPSSQKIINKYEIITNTQSVLFFYNPTPNVTVVSHNFVELFSFRDAFQLNKFLKIFN